MKMPLYLLTLFVFLPLVINVSIAQENKNITVDMRSVEVNIYNNASRPDLWIGYRSNIQGAAGWYGVPANEFKTEPVYTVTSSHQSVKFLAVGVTSDLGKTFIPSLPESCVKTLTYGDTIKITGNINIFESPKEPTAQLHCTVTRAD